MHVAASSRGVSRSAWAADGLPVGVQPQDWFYKAPRWMGTFDPIQKYEVRRKRSLAGRPLNLVWGRFSIGNPQVRILIPLYFAKTIIALPSVRPWMLKSKRGRIPRRASKIGFTGLIL
jgi:hypothetical protein